MPLAHCIDLTRRNDRTCFPAEMWLTATEWDMLLGCGAQSTLLCRNEIVIGQAITLPEPFVQDSLSVVDGLFSAVRQGVYSYSEAIIPDFQNQGYGQLLIEEMAIRLRAQGYSRITAHVRTRHGWHLRRKKKLSVSNTRLVYDFWTNPLDNVVEFQSVLLQQPL